MFIFLAFFVYTRLVNRSLHNRLWSYGFFCNIPTRVGYLCSSFSYTRVGCYRIVVFIFPSYYLRLFCNCQHIIIVLVFICLDDIIIRKSRFQFCQVTNSGFIKITVHSSLDSYLALHLLWQ